MTGTLTMNPVKNGLSRHEDEEKAVKELAKQIAQPGCELVLFFTSTRYDLDRLGKAIAHTFPGVAAGCTTAGEIGCEGYTNDGIVGMSLGPGPVHVHSYCIPRVKSFDPELLQDIRSDFDRKRRYRDRGFEDCCGILLVDGLCLREENLVAGLHGRFEPMNIIGGSAGDDFAFKETHVFGDGSFFSEGAVFLVCEMGGVPFRTFRLQDFQPITDYMVITEADPDERLVKEIDCEPASDLYSKVLGIPVDELTFDNFASHSLMVTIGGQDYIRSVRSREPEGFLRLHSAIDEGVVVRICRSDDTMVSLKYLLSSSGDAILDTHCNICFDCMHRKIELKRQGSLDSANELLKRIPTIGFTTYGEICDSLHVNQTMTGVLIGYSIDHPERLV